MAVVGVVVSILWDSSDVDHGAETASKNSAATNKAGELNSGSLFSTEYACWYHDVFGSR